MSCNLPPESYGKCLSSSNTVIVLASLCPVIMDLVSQLLSEDTKAGARCETVSETSSLCACWCYPRKFSSNALLRVTHTGMKCHCLEEQGQLWVGAGNALYK